MLRKFFIGSFFGFMSFGCKTNSEADMKSDVVSRPGFRRAVVLTCEQVSRAGSATYRAEVVRVSSDFGPATFEALIYSMGSETPESFSSCKGAIETKDLACKKEPSVMTRPGFSETFKIDSQLPGKLTAVLSASGDFGGSMKVEFFCEKKEGQDRP